MGGSLKTDTLLAVVCVLLTGCVGRALYPESPELRLQLHIVGASAQDLTVEVESGGVKKVYSVPNDRMVEVALPAEPRGCRPVSVFGGSGSPRTVLRVRHGRRKKVALSRAELESLLEHGGVPVQLLID